MNKIILTNCRLTRDPELRHTQTNKAVVNFSIAVNEKYKDKESVYFFTVTAWDRLAEFAGKYLKKGTAVNIDGKLTQRTYEKEGKKVSIVEILAARIEFGNNGRGEKSENKPAEPADDFPDFGSDSGEVPF